MNQNHIKANNFFNKVTSHYKAILALSIILMLSVSVFIVSMKKDTSYDAFLPADDPVLVFKNKVKETFSLNDPMVIAIVNKKGVFNKETLGLVHELSEKIQSIPGIDPDKITSLATENNIVGTEEGLEVDPFFELDELTDTKAIEVAQAIDNFELYRGNLVSDDYTMTLVVAEMLESYNQKQHEVYKSLMTMLDDYQYRDEQFFLAGEGAVNGYLARYIDEDAKKTNPFAALIISIILLIAYKRLRGVVLPNLMVLAAVGISLGAMAAFGVNFYVITNGLPVVLIAIAVADGIHILGEYYENAAKFPEFTQQELVIHTMVHMWRPIAITSVTTVAGFLAIAASAYMPPMTYFGLFGALGVAIALVYAVFMIPAAMMLVKPQMSKAYKPNQEIDGFGKFMQKVGNIVVKHPKYIVVTALIIIGFGVNGAVKLLINEDRIKNFQSEEPIVIADAAINSKIDGTSHLDILIETPEVEDLFDPINLKKMEALQEYVESLPYVNGSISIVDFIKKMNQSLSDDKANIIPTSKELIAQYFLLYSASGDPTDFDNYIDYDYRLANIRFKMNTGEYLHEKEVVEKTNAYIQEHLNTDTIKATATGNVGMDVYWIGRLGSNHFLGAGLALLVVLLFAAISFRSIWAGVLTIVPVSISVLFIYTVMGVMDIWLAVGTSMFAAIAIGVGVDFAVHTIDRLKFLLQEKQLSLQNAYVEFYTSAGRALLFNFLALALGFGVLMTSSVPPLSQFGFLVAVAVSVSFVGSMTLLPAIIYLIKPKFLNIKKD